MYVTWNIVPTRIFPRKSIYLLSPACYAVSACPFNLCQQIFTNRDREVEDHFIVLFFFNNTHRNNTLCTATTTTEAATWENQKLVPDQNKLNKVLQHLLHFHKLSHVMLFSLRHRFLNGPAPGERNIFSNLAFKRLIPNKRPWTALPVLTSVR